MKYSGVMGNKLKSFISSVWDLMDKNVVLDNMKYLGLGSQE